MSIASSTNAASAQAPAPRKRPALGAAFAVGAALLFAVNGTVSKVVMEAGVSSMRLVEFRCVGAALFLVAWVAVTRPSALRVRPRELGFLALYGIIGIALVQWFYLVAIARMPVGIALLLEFTAPLLIALWVRFVREEAIRARVWVALVCCLAGLALVAQVWRGVTLDGVGVLAGVGAAVALAAYFLLGERGLGGRDTASLAAWAFVFAGLLWSVLQPWWTLPTDVLAGDVAWPGPFAAVVSPVWVLVAWIVVLGTVVPFLLTLGAIRNLGATRSGLIGTVEPVAAGLVAWVVLGEVLAPVQVAGALVVVAGIMLAETARPDHGTPPPAPEGVVA